ISATATDEDGTFAAGNTVAVQVDHVAPSLTISGAPTVNKNALYTLNLSPTAMPGHPIQQWSINWGDGTPTQVIQGSPASVTHVFTTGAKTYSITAQAVDDIGVYTAGSPVPVSTLNLNKPSPTITGGTTVNEGVIYTLRLAATAVTGQPIQSW